MAISMPYLRNTNQTGPWALHDAEWIWTQVFWEDDTDFIPIFPVYTFLQICLHDKTTTSQFQHCSDDNISQLTQPKIRNKEWTPKFFSQPQVPRIHNMSPPKKWANISSELHLLCHMYQAKLQAGNTLKPNLIPLTTHSTCGQPIYNTSPLFHHVFSWASPRQSSHNKNVKRPSMICQATLGHQCGTIRMQQISKDILHLPTVLLCSLDETCGFP